MNRTGNIVRNRLSLRHPQEESLEILSVLADRLTLRKNVDLASELEKVRSLYPICTEFERNFPSVCFALATGVGKTRLMGAFIAYLYIEKGIKNFFVLAPNLTIYDKLIDDFGNPQSPKYVFHGIGEFVHNSPRIITGDNYNQQSPGQIDLFSSITINVFNISKINAEARAGNIPKMKRLSEYIGQSYFEYLSSLTDLILLMDESHHYRADRGIEVINELNPILGLELTATPQVERGQSTIKFKNVVYEYSLAKAIKDGFVKDPAVATRKDFDPSRYKGREEDMDIVKLEDGIRIHEDTKVELDMYARNNRVKPVKPFVLVVAKDTEHAKRLKDLITSNNFFEGRYKDKVIEVHSNQRGEEREENIQQLLALEDSDNIIEIVIHVNMLKEGWDVTNLYTIIPLRTAASTTLREQTIGRGLRLPYGKRTGNEKVDRLTIVSHDKFQEIVDLANRPDSLIKKENIIEIELLDIEKTKIVVTGVSIIEKNLHEEMVKAQSIENEEDKNQAIAKVEAKKEIIAVISGMNKEVRSAAELKKSKEKAIKKLKESIESNPQQTMIADFIIKEAEKSFSITVEDYINNIIEIPRMTLIQSEHTTAGFHDFDLDTKSLNFQPTSEKIVFQRLRDGKSFEIETDSGKVKYDSLENIIVNELINYPEVDYDECSDLLFKLAGQAVAKFSSYIEDESDIINVIQSYKREIGRYIYTQMMEPEHFYFEAPVYEKPRIYPFDRIIEHNFTKFELDEIYYFRQTITPTSDIPKKVFSGFKKACHDKYKFKSKTEKDFTIILEEENNGVIKWLMPARDQFNIYWDKSKSRRYEPDFVVETADTIYMVETKSTNLIDTDNVHQKALAGLEYCKNATEYTSKNEGKTWKYVLIPHTTVLVNISFQTLMKQFEFKG